MYDCREFDFVLLFNVCFANSVRVSYHKCALVLFRIRLQYCVTGCVLRLDTSPANLTRRRRG